MPAQTMAVVRTRGDPNVVSARAVKALYGAVFSLKFALKKQGQELNVAPLRARWPDAHLKEMAEWTGVWGLPIPEGTGDLQQKDPGIPVTVDVWYYGTVAQVQHNGPFSTEQPAVARLHEFITESGYEISGEHEEEYLTRPGAADQRTLIRYPVRPRAPVPA